MHQTQGQPSTLKKTLMALRAHIDPNILIVLIPHCHQSIGHSAEDQQRNFTITPHIRPKRCGWYQQSISPNNKVIHILSSVHGTFSKIDHILEYNASLNIIFHYPLPSHLK
jgi:hypothetical protein